MSIKKFILTINIPKKIIAVIWVLLAASLAYLAYGYKGAFWVTFTLGFLVISNLKD